MEEFFFKTFNKNGINKYLRFYSNLSFKLFTIIKLI